MWGEEEEEERKWEWSNEAVCLPFKTEPERIGLEGQCGRLRLGICNGRGRMG